MYEPRASKSKKSPEQGAGQPFTEKGHIPLHVWHRDVTHDVTAP